MGRDEFRSLVGAMRAAQKRYFLERRPRDLDDSKALERQVDRALAEFARRPDLLDLMSGRRPGEEG
jgi:hypothetical protein